LSNADNNSLQWRKAQEMKKGILLRNPEISSQIGPQDGRLREREDTINKRLGTIILSKQLGELFGQSEDRNF